MPRPVVGFGPGAEVPPSAALEGERTDLPQPFAQVVPDDVQESPWAYIAMAVGVLAWKNRAKITAAVKRIARRGRA